MDGGSYEGLRSPPRPWAQQTPPLPHSPRTPQSAYALRTPQSAYTALRTPNGRPAVHSSLAALEAKSTSTPMHVRGDGEDKWRRLGARILPVFTGDRLPCTIEECNEVVRSCLRSSEQLDQVWPEIHGILRMGMASVVRILYRQCNVAPQYEPRASAQTVAMPSAALLCECARMDVVVDALAGVWELVFSHVLPTIEGVFLPLVQFGVATNGARSLCVRNAVLLHFRDSIVVPLLPALDEGARTLWRAAWLPSCVHMMTVLAALNPSDRGQFYQTARALSCMLQT
ncbi:hypothetical protein H4S00_001652 [Coemansia sp. D1744]|nr:hypothetical protein H4S00_001652 [Coemansia sp. D1744]